MENGDGNSRMSPDELVWCLKTGNVEEVQHHLRHRDVNRLLNGRTALHHAADAGQLEVADILIKSGANVNAIDAYGITPLLAAVWENHWPVVELLIGNGANKNALSPDGQPLLECTEDMRIRQLLA